MSNKYFPIILLIITVLLAGRYLLLPGYFFMHDDIQVMRQFQMEKCFLDGQIPCRWSPDFGAGYGLPMFNFYSPFANYLGIVIRLLGFSFVDTVKLNFLISLMVGAFGMYFLLKKLQAPNIASLTAAISYTWAPYHLLDVFVRGALAESWGMAWIPWLVYALVKYLQNPHLNSKILFSVMICLMLFSHNVLSLWVLPIVVTIGFIILTFQKNTKQLITYIFHIILGVGLSSFFVIPALFEKSLVHTQTLTQDYYDYRLHFVSLSQFFIHQPWGYGPSVPGPQDQISFHLGYPQIASLIFSFITAIHLIKRKQIYPSIFIIFLLAVSLLLVTLMHSVSYRIWELVPALTWTQFPWRLLSLSAFVMSLALGISLIHAKKNQWISILFILANILNHWNYSVPSKYDPAISDTDKLTGTEFARQQMGAIRDYQPINVPLGEIPLSNYQPFVQNSTQYRVENFIYNSNAFSFDLFPNSNDQIEIITPIFYFPNWTININGKYFPIQPEPQLGRISVVLPKEYNTDSKYIVSGRLLPTSTQKYANLVSTLSLIITFILISKHAKTTKI